MRINLHLVSGAGIQTHNLLIMSLFLLPLDHGSRPFKTFSSVVFVLPSDLPIAYIDVIEHASQFGMLILQLKERSLFKFIEIYSN